VATLRNAADIIDAMRGETAQLSEEARVLSEKTRLAAMRSLFSRDTATIASTGSTDENARQQAETDWRNATAEWERELEAVQTDLFRSKSPELSILQLWALTRLYGAPGFRAGVDAIAAMLEGFAQGAGSERWEMLPSLDSGDRDDVLPRSLGRSQLLGGETVLGSRTSIDRIDRVMRGEADPAVGAAVEQEISALGNEDIVRLEALYREAADRVELVRKLADAANVQDCSNMLEASRVLLLSAAKIIRTEAPDQFAPESSTGAPASTGGAGAAGGRTDFSASEEGYVAARERKFRELEAIGAWFRKYEPHNPIGHVVPPLVRRASLDLPGLLSEVFAAAGFDRDQREKLFRYLATSDPEVKPDGGSGN